MRSYARSFLALAALMIVSAACGDSSPPFIDAGTTPGNDASSPIDAPTTDAMTIDAMTMTDGGVTPDATLPDAPVVVDAGTTDAGAKDAGMTIDAAPQAPRWRAAQPIENLPGNAHRPIAGMDGAGRAFVAWINMVRDPQDASRSYGEVRVSRFDPATGWGNSTALSPSPTAESFADNLDLAVGTHGEAMVVWYQYNGTNDVDTLVRRFTPNGGWEPATVLFDATTAPASGRPTIAIAADGSAIAMWSQRGGDLGLDSQLYARRFTPSGGWQPATPVHVVDGGDAIADDVAMDASGRAVAVWTLHTPPSQIWSSRFSGAGWSTPVRIDGAAWMEDVIGTSGPAVCTDAAGDAVAVFGSFNGDLHRIWAAIGAPDGSWQSATEIEDPTMYATFSSVACDSMGNAIAVWQASPGNMFATSSIRARRFSPIHGWGAWMDVESFADGASSPQIAMTPTGTATVVFVSGTAVWANRFAGSFGAPAQLSTTGTGAYGIPAVAAGGLDSAVASWAFSSAPGGDTQVPFDVWATVYR